MFSFFKRCFEARKNASLDLDKASSETFMSVDATLAAHISIINVHEQVCDDAKQILNDALIEMKQMYGLRTAEEGGGTIIDEAGRIKCNQITVGAILYALAIHDLKANDIKGIPTINKEVLAMVSLHPAHSPKQLREKISYMALVEKSIHFNGLFSNHPCFENQIHLDFSSDPKAIVKWPVKVHQPAPSARHPR